MSPDVEKDIPKLVIPLNEAVDITVTQELADDRYTDYIFHLTPKTPQARQILEGLYIVMPTSWRENGLRYYSCTYDDIRARNEGSVRAHLIPTIQPEWASKLGLPNGGHFTRQQKDQIVDFLLGRESKKGEPDSASQTATGKLTHCPGVNDKWTLVRFEYPDGQALARVRSVYATELFGKKLYENPAGYVAAEGFRYQTNIGKPGGQFWIDMAWYGPYGGDRSVVGDPKAIQGALKKCLEILKANDLITEYTLQTAVSRDDAVKAHYVRRREAASPSSSRVEAGLFKTARSDLSGSEWMQFFGAKDKMLSYAIRKLGLQQIVGNTGHACQALIFPVDDKVAMAAPIREVYVAGEPALAMDRPYLVKKAVATYVPAKIEGRSFPLYVVGEQLEGCRQLALQMMRQNDLVTQSVLDSERFDKNHRAVELYLYSDRDKRAR